MKHVFLVIALLMSTTLAQAQETIPLAHTNITTQTGHVLLTLEVAATPEQRKIGLMDRKNIGMFNGMMFIFPKANDYEFWMSNTYISLDMIFVSPENKIVYIAENTKPMTVTGHSAKQLVKTVIELPGGAARADNIQVGDYVKYTVSPPVEVH